MKPTHRNPLLRNFVLAATICLTLGQASHAASLTWDGSDTGNSPGRRRHRHLGHQYHRQLVERLQ